MPRKAAVVIGVNKPGDFSPLNSAASGAEDVAKWLKGEGYDVTCITDETKPVTAKDIETVISGYVTQPARYHMLVVYFSGHGQYSHTHGSLVAEWRTHKFQ